MAQVNLVVGCEPGWMVRFPRLAIVVLLLLSLMPKFIRPAVVTRISKIEPHQGEALRFRIAVVATYRPRKGDNRFSREPRPTPAPPPRRHDRSQ